MPVLVQTNTGNTPCTNTTCAAMCCAPLRPCNSIQCPTGTILDTSLADDTTCGDASDCKAACCLTQTCANTECPLGSYPVSQATASCGSPSQCTASCCGATRTCSSYTCPSDTIHNTNLAAGTQCTNNSDCNVACCVARTCANTVCPANTISKSADTSACGTSAQCTDRCCQGPIKCTNVTCMAGNGYAVLVLVSHFCRVVLNVCLCIS